MPEHWSRCIEEPVEAMSLPRKAPFGIVSNENIHLIINKVDVKKATASSCSAGEHDRIGFAMRCGLWVGAAKYSVLKVLQIQTGQGVKGDES